MELDHIFVMVNPGAPEARRLEEMGLVCGGGRDHPGQGTSNKSFYFHNAFLELLFANDADPVTDASVKRTKLAERARWRETGACPFGIAFRGRGPEQGLPVECWDYEAPYGLTIPVACLSEDSSQPFLFRSPGKARPDQWERDIPFQPDYAEIGYIRLQFPKGAIPAADLAAFAERGLIEILTAGEEYRLDLELVSKSTGKRDILSLPEFMLA